MLTLVNSHLNKLELLAKQERREMTAVGHSALSINIDENELGKDVLQTILPVPKLSEDDMMLQGSKFILGGGQTSLMNPNSKAAKRAAPPLKKRTWFGRTPTSEGQDQFRPTTEATDPALRQPKKRRINDDAPVAAKKLRLQQTTASKKNSWNRFPCTCLPFTTTRGSHKTGCARGAHFAPIAAAIAASPTLKFGASTVPKPIVGEIIEFLPSAKPRYAGWVCYPRKSATSTSWVEIGMRCTLCNGFGLSPDSAKQSRYTENIARLIKSKVTTVVPCTCQSLLSVPVLPPLC
jgi:hypothetical protein